MCAISVLLLLVETSSALRLPPTLLDISRQHASAVACAALLASSQPVMPAFAISCQLDCFKECNKVSRRGQRAAALTHSALEQQPLAVPELRTRVHLSQQVAPGSGAYCTSQCDTYCADVGDDYQRDVVRGEATPAVDTSKCDAYKTDAAKKYCQGEAASKVCRASPNPTPYRLTLNPSPNPKPQHQPEAGEGLAAGR